MVQFNGLILGIAVVMLGLAVMLFLLALIELSSGVIRRVLIREKLAGNAQQSLPRLLVADLCTNGVALCRLPAQLLLRIPLCSRPIDEILLALQLQLPGCSRRAVMEAVLSASILSALTLLVLTAQPLIACVGLCIPLLILRSKALSFVREHKNRLREQLPDALRGLGMCFSSGLSLQQAFQQTAEECREPLKKELRRTVDDLHTGSSIMESLDSLDARLALDDMRFVSVALEIQHRTGGSMREVLEGAADSLLASFDLSRSLEVQTAQARLSARVVSILPLALVLILSMTMEGYLATFFSSFEGLMLLVCAIAMELMGILAIRKILGIDLG